MSTNPFEQKELSLLLNAVQSYKVQQEEQSASRKAKGWDTSEQSKRVQLLDEIEEKIFTLLD
ncbi:hypothetical protein VH441_03620 [Psychrobacter sp. HD31]|uniref:hypothetical protein n=1 Tax=Psychrobacter sp. HD31 TaxID=3112003 RepID=UPI003DA1E27D